MNESIRAKNNLIEEFMKDCVEMKKTRVPDGLGGFRTQWTQGEGFRAAVNKNSSLAASVAEKQGVTEIYTVTTNAGVGLEYHEVFKRLEDGATFRVTTNSQDSRPPSVATFDFEQVKAERWELT
ncbi:MAG: hypothetical protein J6M56_00120 [Clostridia bacterium]|nr:hypothetical protein [Clostridia bacterium]